MSRDMPRPFGNLPGTEQKGHRCYWSDAIESQLTRLHEAHGKILPFGSGLSYGDSCLSVSGHVLQMRWMDRILETDWAAGRIRAEAGATLEDILRIAIPHGWFLPVTPGTKYVSLGGAVANDVHGKNHHKHGTFGCHVPRFSLVRSDLGRRVCSAAENPDLYAATIGGLGLTGVIEWVDLQLQRISSTRLTVETRRFLSLQEGIALSAELDEKYDYCVAWVDCGANKGRLGRGVYMAGNFDEGGPLEFIEPSTFRIPWTPPFSLINGLSRRAFNELYWRAAATKPLRASVGYNEFFYPLDSMIDWNRIYGTGGFQQLQSIVPLNSADAIIEILAVVAALGEGSALSVLKTCGDLHSPGLMSFPKAGITLAMDFPDSKRLRNVLLPRLDAIIRAAGGRMYPAKDAHMSSDDFRTAYPKWSVLEQARDPAILSRFWKRVAH